MIRSLTIHDAPFQVLDVGAGRPLLLVHGFPLDHELWAPQVAALASCCRLIVPDLRGFGGSSATSGTVTMARFADDLADILDALQVDPPITLAGLSMGGYVAFAYLQKFAAQVGALVLVATRAEADTPEAAGGRLQMAETVLREGPGPVVEAMLPKLVGPVSAQRQPQLIESVRAMMMRQSRDGIAAALRGLAVRMDAHDLLATIDVPTWVIAGSDDVITPPDGMRAMATAIDGAHFTELDNVGHLVSLEAPDELNAILTGIMTQ